MVQQDAELAALEKQHADVLGLITELNTQRAGLEKQAKKLVREIKRRKKALTK